MSDNTSPNESLGLEDFIRYRYFPIIAEVDKDYRNLSDNQKNFHHGDLLWLLRTGADEITGARAVRVSRFDAPSMEFPVVIDNSIKVYNRDYSEVCQRMDKDSRGPLMEIGELANLVKDPERPIFAVRGDDYSRKNQRILIHSKDKVEGYLAKGRSNCLIIPKNFNGQFVETKPKAPTEQKEFTKVLDIVKERWQGEVKVCYSNPTKDPLEDRLYPGDIIQIRGLHRTNAKLITVQRFQSSTGKLGSIQVAVMCSGKFEVTMESITNDGAQYQHKFFLKELKGADSFPVEVSYADINTDPYLMSLEYATLRQESPLIVLGICKYTSVYTSLQEGDPTSTPFHSARIYPAYTSMKIRAASPVPVHIHVIKNLKKPSYTVHVLNQKEYTTLEDSMVEVKSDTLSRKWATLHKHRPTSDSDDSIMAGSPTGNPTARMTPSKSVEEKTSYPVARERLNTKSQSTRNGGEHRQRSSTVGSQPVDRIRANTFAGLKAKKLFDDPGPRSKSANMSMSPGVSSLSTAAFLKRKHEEKKRKISANESQPLQRSTNESESLQRLSKDLSGSLPDLSNLDKIQNRPVPLPPSVIISKEFSDSLPDLRDQSRISHPRQHHPLPPLPSGGIVGSLPDLRAAQSEPDPVFSDNHLRPLPPLPPSASQEARRRSRSLSELHQLHDDVPYDDEDTYVDMTKLRKAIVKLDLLNDKSSLEEER